MSEARTALINKAKKLFTLANQGADGEKEAAALILNRLMDKYGISDSDLEEETISLEWFRYKDKLNRRLLIQVIYMVLGPKEIYRRKDGRGKLVSAYCTLAERLEIEITFDFFSRAMDKELERFLQAFIIKNHLYPTSDKDNSEDQEISEEEWQKLCYMIRGMEYHKIAKMIGE